MGLNQYIMIGLAAIILILVTTCSVEYGVIKGLQSDKIKLAAELKVKEEIQVGLYRDREVTSTELSVCQEALTNCRNSNVDIDKILDEYKKSILSVCKNDSSRLRNSWEKCEDKLREALGGTYDETCEDLISRSIAPYYFK